MSNPKDDQPRPSDRLRDPEVDRVLNRASELDALRGDRTVAELRSAAQEAGISAASFDAALAELRSPPARRRGRKLSAIVAAFLIIAGSILYARSRAPVVPPGPPMTEQALVLRCLTPEDAAALARPIFNFPGNTILIAPERAPHILNVRGTQKQLDDVRALLAKYDNSCQTPPPTPPPAQ